MLFWGEVFSLQINATRIEIYYSLIFISKRKICQNKNGNNFMKKGFICGKCHNVNLQIITNPIIRCQSNIYNTVRQLLKNNTSYIAVFTKSFLVLTILANKNNIVDVHYVQIDWLTANKPTLISDIRRFTLIFSWI